MIARLIGWSAENLMLVLIATAFAVVAGIWARSVAAAGRHSRSLRHAGDCLHRVSGQAPQVVEDQVTYPMTTPHADACPSRRWCADSRSSACRSSTLSSRTAPTFIGHVACPRIPECRGQTNRPGVNPTSGLTPPASAGSTSTRWRAKNKSLAALRSLQDWEIRFGLAKAEGVAEVASVGGIVKQYAVVVDPGRCVVLGIPLSKVRDAIRGATWMSAVGRWSLASTSSWRGGRGYLKGIERHKHIVVKVVGGTRYCEGRCSRDLQATNVAASPRVNGEGEVASGIALQRFGANALTVIDNIKERLKEITPSLPEGTEIVPVYDRSELIHRAIAYA